MNAMRLLGMANVQTGQSRRLQLAYKFQKSHQVMCERQHDFKEGKFFGDFDAAVALQTSAHKSQAQAFQPPKPKDKPNRRQRFRRQPNPYPRTSELQNLMIQSALGSMQQQQFTAFQPQNFLGQTPPPALMIPSLFQSLYPNPPKQRGQNNRGRRGEGKTQLTMVSVPLPSIPVGGRLKHFFPQWRSITSDPEILDMVSGMHLEFVDFPQQFKIPKPLVFSKQEMQAADILIGSLLTKNAIEPCSHEPGEFISTVFLRQKSNGSYRLILNLKNFNLFMVYNKFNMS